MPETTAKTAEQAAEIAALTALLREDWTDWLDTCAPECDGWKTVEIIHGENRSWTRTVEVVTRGPSGQHYSWEYEEGLSEDHPSFGPCEYGDPDITPVWPRDQAIAVRTWEVTPADEFVTLDEHLASGAPIAPDAIAELEAQQEARRIRLAELEAEIGTLRTQRSDAYAVLASIAAEVGAPEGTRWEFLPEMVRALRARVAELEARTAVARPDAKNPTRPLIQAAYIAQDDISKPPEPWAIRAAADVVNAYIDITERVAAEEARRA